MKAKTENTAEPQMQRGSGHWIGRFTAMASPCEVLVETEDAALAARLARIAAHEARRVERKFSRYRRDNIVHRINSSAGQPTEVDTETANLLDYADTCFQLSDGLFDITSGALRAVWRFDGSDRVPAAEQVAQVAKRIGWSRVTWSRPRLHLPAGMEIDLGGLGKEYAVDRTVQLLRQHTPASLVVNFGGDLVVTGPRRDGTPWSVGLDDPRRDKASLGAIALERGALATSGDARRFLLRDGIRYSHILDPRSGWPVQGAPRSVTVCAGTCMEAGMLATMASLRGEEAEDFLRCQGVNYWIG